jgi:hypothetical protein
LAGGRRTARIGTGWARVKGRRAVEAHVGGSTSLFGAVHEFSDDERRMSYGGHGGLVGNATARRGFTVGEHSVYQGCFPRGARSALSGIMVVGVYGFLSGLCVCSRTMCLQPSSLLGLTCWPWAVAGSRGSLLRMTRPALLQQSVARRTWAHNGAA